MSEGFPNLYRRIDDLGLTVPVGRTLLTEDGTAEIVKTYADCSITAIFYRRAPGSFAIPSVLDPSEISSGSGGQVGELLVMRYGPVDPDRREITVSFRGFASGDDEDGVAIPVDRRLTAPFDRFLAGPALHSERDGAHARVLSMQAGLLRTSVELLIEAADPSILAIQLGRFPHRFHGIHGPGPTDLWRDWWPPASSGRTEVRRKGNEVSLSISSSVRATARRLSPQEIADLPPRREPPPDWTATANPGGRPLAIQGGSGRGGPPPEHTEIQPILYFDPPGEETESIGLSLDRLWSYRYDHARVTVPAPRPDVPVDLKGITIEGETCRLALERWDPAERGFSLHSKPDPPDAWPDIRVLAGGSSAGLWTQPPEEGEMSGGLPLSHAALFTATTIELAMRMVARAVAPISLTLPLTRGGDQTAG
jgi:hypothetical protein